MVKDSDYQWMQERIWLMSLQAWGGQLGYEIILLIVVDVDKMSDKNMRDIRCKREDDLQDY